MTEGEIKTSLLIGASINVNNKFEFKSPVLKDILKTDFDKMMANINATYDLNFVLYQNKDINKIIEDNNFSSYETWQFVLLIEEKMQDKNITSYLIKCLTDHFGGEVTIELEDDCIIKIDGKEFNKEDYLALCKILHIAYGLEERIEERKFCDNIARRKAIEMRINRSEINRIENKDSSFLYQILSVLKAKKDDNELQNSNLFQLTDIYRRLVKEKDYDNLMTGIYTGNVDYKKIDIDKKHWTSKL